MKINVVDTGGMKELNELIWYKWNSRGHKHSIITVSKKNLMGAGETPISSVTL